ncbi:MAG: SpoIIE family protein phosphatase [Gammaproteobacteria bacterium SHHR-1]|uniref:ATP-binding SpoIIE family protein phosphatase n=1 Tax=Magnetovirga frankeli TaxID=947516 RepID=UPI00129405BA|nr:SpoIIE family protein phosphatase [gamma proteobacterium SS-5]
MTHPLAPKPNPCAQTLFLLVGEPQALAEPLRVLNGLAQQLASCRLAQLLHSWREQRPEAVLIQAPAEDAADAWQGLLDALRHLRELAAAEPLVLLLGQVTTARAEAFIQAGGDDLLPDAEEASLFRLRLSHHCSCLQRRQELVGYRALVAREEAVAQTVLASVVRDDLQQELSNLRWRLSPRALYNGDLILAAKSPMGKIYLLLGSFPGYGLAASIGVLPVAEIFYTMTAKGFGLVDILLEINQRLKALLPSEGFFAASLLEIDLEQGGGAIWNGGLSCMLLQRADGAAQRLGSQHTPLAILDNAQLGRGLEPFTLQQGDHLLLATGGRGQQPSEALPWPIALDGLAACLGPDLEQTLEQVSQHLRQRLGRDEISLLVLRMGARLARKPAGEREILRGGGSSTCWHYDILLDPDTLRNLDPRPMLTQLLVEVQGLQDHREQLYTLVAELFSNALEHGVLRLDSGLKSSPEGFAEYYQEREQRLEQVQQGFVRFSLDHQPSSDGGILSMEVEDSGPGFDYQNKGQGSLALDGLSGRGIGLIRKMAEDVVYFSPGNRVKITYPWTRNPGQAKG